jgi:hypothetical protein
VQIHGVLNAVSWGVLLPLGVVLARYMRVFPSLDPAWFYLHVACQCSGYVIGVAGWIVGLTLGSKAKGALRYPGHRNIGTALFVLSTLQVCPPCNLLKAGHSFSFSSTPSIPY